MSDQRDDYLWDRSGPPDPEVARLEELLGELRHDRPAPDFEAAPRPRRRLAIGGWTVALAAAAALMLALAALWRARPGPGGGGWEFTRLDASGQRATGRDRLRQGQWLITDASSRARLQVGAIGQVEVEPLTRLRLLDAGDRAHRLSLDRGTLHARIWAPPGTFYVNTPSAVAVDLGCAYTLEVDEAGAGRLRVQSGWVGFEHEGRESFVPRGALCLTWPGVGPGTPHYEDSSRAFQQALATLDFDFNADLRPSALRVVLAEARRRDALSLWHLLTRAPGSERGAVHDRLAELVPPPPGVTREGVLADDARMLDAWWDELDLGAAGLWRLWKAPWPPQAR